MSEYINREEAIELLAEPITMSMCLSVNECNDRKMQRHTDLALIQSVPVAHVQAVVYCNECIHYNKAKTNGGGFYRCDRYDKWQDESNRVYMPGNGFCSYGHRKEA